eukprot:3645778-Pleurochrysis_carterae.AAC.1
MRRFAVWAVQGAEVGWDGVRPRFELDGERMAGCRLCMGRGEGACSACARAWCMVRGAWCVVHGAWCMGRVRVRGCMLGEWCVRVRAYACACA